jgi:phospholipid/cholesterol/gamma-HCH transport system substrate-binding protein
MLPRRIYLNLAAFLLLFAALTTWAARNVLRPDFLEQTYAIHAAFDDATGLRPGVEVTLRGVRVGRVAAVSIGPAEADVEMRIESAASLPAGAGAAVRRRSAVGEPYVAIVPPADWRPGGPTMTADARIPLESTSSPLAYGDLFTAADSLVAAVDPASVRTVSHELALALGGRGDELGSTLDASADALTTLAASASELDALGDNLTSLTHTMAERSQTIADATDDLNALVETLATNRSDIETILRTAPGIVDRTNAILAASYAQLVCGAAASATISQSIGSPDTVTQIVRLLQAAETASVVIPQAIYQGPDGRYLSGTFGFAPGEVNDYDVYQEFETPPAVPECAGSPPPSPVAVAHADVASAATSDDGGPSTTVAHDVSAAEPPIAAGGSSEGVGGGSRSFLPIVSASLLVLAALIALASTARSRLRTGDRRHQETDESAPE